MAKKDSTLEWKIEFDDKTYSINLKKELEVDTGNLIQMLKDQPGKFAWFSTVHEFARSYCNFLKRELAATYAETDAKLRDDWPFDAKMTETSIKHAVITDEEYVKLEEEYAAMESKVNLLRIGREAFIQRKDMLIQLGASVREEMKNEEY